MVREYAALPSAHVVDEAMEKRATQWLHDNRPEAEKRLWASDVRAMLTAALSGVSAPVGVGDLTIRELQTRLPWTIRYSRDFRASPAAHKDFAHALHHVSKAAGKLHALADDMDHDREVADDPALRSSYGKYVADLVVCALRLANTFPGGVLDLQQATQARIEDKNGVALTPPAAAPRVEARKPRPFCRDCADENGVCPHSGERCDGESPAASEDGLPSNFDDGGPYNGIDWQATCEALQAEVAELRRRLAASGQGVEWVANDADIAAWLERHDLERAIRGTDARCAFEDARSAHKVAVPTQEKARQ